MKNIFAHVRDWLTFPELRDLNVDDPKVTILRRQIILKNTFLRKIYEYWYDHLWAALPEGNEPVLELGSGGGFFSNRFPDLISSEVFYYPYARVILDGQRLPFPSVVLRGIVMTNVLHHIPCARQFLAEAARCVRPGGVITMIEPWMTRWSRLVYMQLHHEPFNTRADVWEFPPCGPLSGANIALPWIIFERDREHFERDFPSWKIESIRLMMPFQYLVSGGVSLRPLMPGFSFRLWEFVERLLTPWMNTWAMFAQITLRRNSQNCAQ